MRITLDKKVSQEIYKELGIARYTGNIRFALRLEAIILLTDEYNVEKVAKFCGVTLRSIYNWISSFILDRIDGLRTKKSSGRKPKLTKTQKKELKSMILENPEKYGYESGIWTCAIIQDLIYQKFGIEYSVGYINQLLSQLNLSYKKVDAISHKADKQEQKRFMSEVLPEIISKALRVNGAILFQDESTFRQWSRVTYSWGEKGKPLVAEVNMNSNTQRVFGAIEMKSGKFIYKLTDKANERTFLSFLYYLLKFYKGTKIFLIIDNSRIHGTELITKFLLKNRDKIELVRLPKYSPMLNPIEKLWKKIKRNYMHNKYFENKAAFIKCLLKALKNYKNNASEVSGVMKKFDKVYNELKADFDKKFSNILKLKTLVA